MTQPQEPAPIPVTEELLGEIVRRIRTAGDPLKIVLFGSHARGDADPTGDTDLLIIGIEEESDPPRYKRSPKYYSATWDTFPARDIVVWTPDEVGEWAAVSDHSVTTALREGRVLHERTG